MKSTNFLFLLLPLASISNSLVFAEEISRGPQVCGFDYLMETTTDYSKGVTFKWRWKPEQGQAMVASYSIDIPFNAWNENTYLLPPNANEATFSATVGTHTFYLLGMLEPGYMCGESRTFHVPIAATPADTERDKPSANLLKKVNIIQKAVSEEKDDDRKTLYRILRKPECDWAPYEKAIYQIILDTKVDWRVRYVCAMSVLGSIPISAREEWYLALAKILNDSNENTRFREEIATLFRARANPTNTAIQKAFGKAIKDPKLPLNILEDVLFGISSGGVDDINYLIDMYPWDKSVFKTKYAGIPLASVQDAAIMGAAISKSSYAINFLFKVFEKGECKNCVLPAFSRLIFEDPITRAQVRDRMIPVLLEWYRQPKSDHQTMANLFAQFKAKEAVDDILATLRPVSEGGDNSIDVRVAIEALVEIGDKKAIPHIEKLYSGFALDSRWSDIPNSYPGHKYPGKFPEDAYPYREMKWNIDRLKGENPGPRPKAQGQRSAH